MYMSVYIHVIERQIEVMPDLRQHEKIPQEAVI